LVGAGLVVAVLIFYFATVYWEKDRRSHFTAYFLKTVPDMQKFYGAEKPKIIEVDDGIVGYATDYPTMSWLGFTLDPQAVEAKRKGHLLDLAVERGFDRLSSVNYFNATGLNTKTPPSVIKDKLSHTFFLSPKEAEPYSFHVEYVSPNGFTAVIRITRQTVSR
jgi:hypothetical protein